LLAAASVPFFSPPPRLLDWDPQTMMPPKGQAFLANQLAQLACMTHEMQV